MQHHFRDLEHYILYSTLPAPTIPEKAPRVQATIGYSFDVKPASKGTSRGAFTRFDKKTYPNHSDFQIVTCNSNYKALMQVRQVLKLSNFYFVIHEEEHSVSISGIIKLI